MSLTIVLSGPVDYGPQAQAALANAGFRLVSTEKDHGLPAMADGTEPSSSQQHITVEGDDLDGAVTAVRAFGWVLRMHYETPPPPPPRTLVALPLADIEDMRREIAALKARIR